MIRKAVTVVRHLVLTQSVQSPSVSQEVQHCIEKRASLPLTGTLSHFLLNHLSSHDQIFKVAKNNDFGHLLFSSVQAAVTCQTKLILTRGN